jgi:hypothetical protein
VRTRVISWPLNIFIMEEFSRRMTQSTPSTPNKVEENKGNLIFRIIPVYRIPSEFTRIREIAALGNVAR